MHSSKAWIYLSPHLDDAVLSCGGVVRQQVTWGYEVSVWTVFTADPPRRVSARAERFHAAWGVDGDPMARRRDEDAASCRILGARHLHLGYPAATYRWSDRAGGWLYISDEEVTGRMHPVDADLVRDLADRLRAILPGAATVACPLALGGHVDHQITRMAAERTGRSLVYYADFPYVRNHSELLDRSEKQGWVPAPVALSREAMGSWQDAVLAHRSQIGGFWPAGEAQVRRDIAEYGGSGRGSALWLPPATGSSPDRARDEGLSFCVVSGGRRPAGLRRLVESIHRQEVPAYEVIVCGDAAPDPSYRLVAANEEAEAGALSRIRNRAAGHARFDHLVFVDDDIELDRDWYTGLRPHLGLHDALTTRIVNTDGTRHWDWAFWRGHGNQQLLGYGEVDRNLYLTGGLMVVRTDVWDRHRWDDDLRYRQQGDVEYSQRLIASGHRVGISTRSTALHHDERYTQVGRWVIVRSERGVARLLDGTLSTMPRAQLVETAAEEWSAGRVAEAADCLRACRARDPDSVIARRLLDLLYRRSGGDVEGNDDWRLPAPGKTRP